MLFETFNSDRCFQHCLINHLRMSKIWVGQEAIEVDSKISVVDKDFDCSHLADGKDILRVVEVILFIRIKMRLLSLLPKDGAFHNYWLLLRTVSRACHRV